MKLFIIVQINHFHIIEQKQYIQNNILLLFKLNILLLKYLYTNSEMLYIVHNFRELLIFLQILN